MNAHLLSGNVIVRWLLRLCVSLSTFVLAGAPGACAAQSGGAVTAEVFAAVDSVQVLADLQALASPAMEGRRTGTPGNEAARRFVAAALTDAGARPLPGHALLQDFPGQEGADSAPGGTNVVAYVPGSVRPERYIVVTAHFDHLGVRAGTVFHGADDNASGTAALLEIARQLSTNRPHNSVILAALDAEEGGLRGARAFVDNPPVPLSTISLNVNLDMISRNDRGELYVSGTYPYPFLGAVVDSIASVTRLRIRKGHDRPDGSAGEDWTFSSDHGPFHAAGIPFLYFGVEDHEDYHQPTDTFERIQPGFYVEAVRSILSAIRLADARLPDIEAQTARDTPDRP
jgi:Zn-dependent M28 family amino/carboxypeptidase